MTKEIEAKIKEIAGQCYDFIYKNNINNWRQVTSEPVDLFVNYCDKDTASEIKSLQMMVTKMNYFLNWKKQQTQLMKHLLIKEFNIYNRY